MRLESFQRRAAGGSIRTSATVVWEDARKDPFDLHYEIDSPSGDHWPDDANAFLCSVAITASRDGERRIAVESAVCPRLADGVGQALALLNRWYGGTRTLPRVEARAAFRPRADPARRAALCLTGGVDSMHALYRNRENRAPSDPESFRRAVYIVHLSFPPGDADDRARDVARRQLRAIRAICERTDLELCAVRTNVRLLEPTLSFTQAEGLGALLSAGGHAQTRSVASLSIGSSSYDASHLRPWGSHPRLDPLYSSADLTVLHEDGGVPRTEKIRRIARWEAAKSLFVCFEGPLSDDRVNCARCEKCLRTMTALLAVGGEDGAEAFGGARVTAERILGMPASYEPREFPYLWEPLAQSMAEIGRRDLERAIRARIRQVGRYVRWREERDWKGRLRRLDRRLFGGALTTASRRLRGIPPDAPVS